MRILDLKPILILALSAALLAGISLPTVADAQESPLRFLRPSVEGDVEPLEPAPPREPPAEMAPEPAPPPPPEPAKMPEAEPMPKAEAETPEPQGEQETPASEVLETQPDEPDPVVPEIEVLEQAPVLDEPPETESEAEIAPEEPVPDPQPSAVQPGLALPGFLEGLFSGPDATEPEPLAEDPSLGSAADDDSEGDAGPERDETVPDGMPAADVDSDGDDEAVRDEAPETDAGNGTMRFGMLAGREIAATMREVEPLADRLEEAIGRPVEILPMSSYGAMIDAQATRRIDGGFYSATAFATAEALCGCLEPLVAPAAQDETVAYYAVIVAWRGDGIVDLGDLQGGEVAVAAADSIGARRMQLAGLAAEGVDPAAYFESVRETASAEEAVRLLAAGDVDAAFAWSSLSGAPETGYSRGTLTDLAARGEIDSADLQIVWRSPAITHGPVAVLDSLPEADKRAIEDALLALEGSDPDAYDALNPLYGGGYVAVDAEDYRGVALLTDQDLDALDVPAPTTHPIDTPTDVVSEEGE